MKTLFHKIVRRINYTALTLVGRMFSYSIYDYKYHEISFSQEGEDRILQRIFENQEKGFYVDIGAHHPQRFSNTYLFYLKGWRGVNIDAMPGSMDEFKHLRPLDINLEFAISNSNQSLIYYQFNEPALNGFSEEISKQRDGIRGEYFITGTKEIQTYRLSEVLDKYLPSEQVIDFMSIDVEGLDLEVLQSNDWCKYRPKLVLVEDLFPFILNKPNESKIFTFMKDKGYDLYAKTKNTLLFYLF
jgi:FkbM family methyltransferase